MILRTGRRKLAEVSEKACKLLIVAEDVDNLFTVAEKRCHALDSARPDGGIISLRNSEIEIKLRGFRALMHAF